MIMKSFGRPVIASVLLIIICALASTCYCRPSPISPDGYQEQTGATLQLKHDNERPEARRSSVHSDGYGGWFNSFVLAEQPAITMARSKRSATGVDQLAGENEELFEKLLAYKSNYNQKKQNAGELRKLTLKRKLHKFIDTIIDDELKAAENAQEREESDSSHASSKVGVPMQRRRLNGSPSGLSNSQHQQSMPVDLRKRLISGGANNDNNSNTNDNLLTDNLQSVNEVKQQAKQAQISASDHARRILDDKFGIMKESIFTTNNHLGNKGVPKFGSDEDF